MNFQALYEQRLAELAQQQGSANGNGANGDSGIILPPARPASNADPLNPRDRPMTASASPSLRVAVLGAGSWGTALAAAAGRRHPTVLWARDAAQAANLAARRENERYLPGISLPPALQYSSDLDATLASLRQDGGAGLIVLGVPVAGLGALCAELASRLPALGLQDTPSSGPARALKPAPPACRTRSCAKRCRRPNAACCPDRPSRAKSRRACRWR